MYQPLGLECGHKFCADCVFTCVGKGRALGTVKAILDHVPAGAACPECRTPGQALRQAARPSSLNKPLSRLATLGPCAFICQCRLTEMSNRDHAWPYSFERTCTSFSELTLTRRSLCLGHPADGNRESHQAEVSCSLLSDAACLSSKYAAVLAISVEAVIGHTCPRALLLYLCLKPLRCAPGTRKPGQSGQRKPGRRKRACASSWLSSAQSAMRPSEHGEEWIQCK